ncbi:MAG TPA: trehalose-6-phosphate synthase, partial [Alphaproteobacteria bacterium]|nr:trehalose-6-phosphate synthase [Alphaproteobacteria bacterium]
MSRLVVVSNRVANLENQGNAGGLAVALGAALGKTGGIWFGWSGTVLDDDEGPGAPHTHTVGNVTVATIDLTQREHDAYYLGFSNQVLWPVFHFRLDLAAFESNFITTYRHVNERFADSLSPMLKADDTVWVHDYHLIPLAEALRAKRPALAIGFFLHIPFPPLQLLAAIPGYDTLVRALFAYDVVGFQTESDVENFRQCVLKDFEGELLPDGRLRAFGRTLVTKAFPIGLDVDNFVSFAHGEEAERVHRRLDRRTTAARHVIGVDRLDYSKGIPNRLRAFERLLENHPEYHRIVTLMQIAPPSRETVEAYADITVELEQLSGHINGRFAEFDWTPVRYIHRNVNRRILAALFRGSKVGLVTPLRDGMNLVAKEYIAAQDPADPGILVLSRFAGAAEELREALIVNPYDIDGTARALHEALSMPLPWRQERHEALMSRVRKGDVHIWAQSFLDTLSAARP